MTIDNPASGKTPVAEMIPASSEHAAPTDWKAARLGLSEGRWYWLATMLPGGRPHVRPILAVLLDDRLYFVSGRTTRKSKNLASNDYAAITVATEAIHLVVEGQAARVQDEAALQRVASEYAAKYGWHVTIRDGAFYAGYGAPTAGPPPYEVYELIPRVVYGFGTGEAFSPTRWRFPG